MSYGVNNVASAGTESQRLNQGLADDFKKMSDDQYAHFLNNSTPQELANIVSNPGVPADRKKEALKMIETLLSQKSDASNTIGGEETPDEQLKDILKQLMKALTKGRSLNPHKVQELQTAVNAAMPPVNTQTAIA